ncbi:hypothetical protein GCM10010420_10850 [Streptomyces glaucosporus]|uniref:Uncharacterized protein n=1 Tax=Streptomyces glaucosporus TaxID=284044 RepID=A0ABP5UX73_9ACTN
MPPRNPLRDALGDGPRDAQLRRVVALLGLRSRPAARTPQKEKAA